MQNNNSSISEDMNRIFDLKGQSTSYVMDYITPMVQVKPTCNIIRNGTLFNGTSSTFYTTPSNKDFYLCGCSLSVIKDATSTSTGSWISFVQQGVARTFCFIAGLTLTAQNDSIVVDFNHPIKIDRGSYIDVNAGTNVANCRSAACIWGYTQETTK